MLTMGGCPSRVITSQVEHLFMNKIQSVIKKTVVLSKQILGDDLIPHHRQVFEGNHRQYLVYCIASDFVSPVGPQVIEIENIVA